MANELHGARQMQPEDLSAFPLNSTVFAVKGTAETLLVRPAALEGSGDTPRTLMIHVEVDDFRIMPGDYVIKTFTAAITDIATAAAHGYATGDGPYQLTSTTTLPAGLSLLTNYYLVVIDVNTFKFSLTNRGKNAADYKASDIIDITDTGTGTHSIGGMPGVPAATELVRGYNSILLQKAGRYGPQWAIAAPSKVTVKGSASGSILTAYWLP